MYLNARRKKRKSLIAREDGVEIKVDGEQVCVASVAELEHVVAILREKPIVIFQEEEQQAVAR